MEKLVRSILVLSIFAFSILTPTPSKSDELLEFFPAEINPDEKYVFYSHGLIVEGNDPRPEHDEYGVYDFPAVKESLFAIGGFNLIAHHRPANTDIGNYVNLFSQWVNQLLEAGVPATNITLIGFSRGSHLTALTANNFNNYPINTVLMAGCFDEDMNFDPPISLSGRFLSIYETTDAAGSCKDLGNRGSLSSFDEEAINTGKKHGAFYRPLSDWIEPIRDWIHIE